jgi:putative endonuclease
MLSKVEAGRRGEQLAADFLCNKGFEVLHRNYRYGKSEIDLIVKKDERLVFVEVKARRNKEYGLPESFVNRSKARRIIKAAENYIFHTNWQGEIRFDIVAITHQPKLEVYHVVDAFF